MKTLRTLLLFSLLTASTTQTYSPDVPLSTHTRFFLLPFLANPELSAHASSILHSRLTGPTLTGIGAAGLVALLLQQRELLGLPHLGAHVRRSAETAFGITLVAGVLAWLWHEFCYENDPCLPQPYDFSDDSYPCH